MKIKGWDKIHGYTYKGYCIVNPIHDANEEGYFANILDLNQVPQPKWEIELSINNNTGVIKFSIKDIVTQLLLAKSHLTKTNIHTLQKFREQYEMLIDDILEEAQSYIASKVTKNINGGTTGIINQVQSTGTNVLFNSSYGSSSLSTTTPALLIQALKDLQKQIDDYNKKL